MLNRRLDDAIPFEWHHHPEFELTLTRNSRGLRFVGDHVGSYDDFDLVLVGSNLPHTWVSYGKIDPGAPHVALVFWFGASWIDSLVSGSVELRPVATLIAGAEAGLAFGPEVGAELAEDFEAMFDLPPAQRLIRLLAILTRLAEHGGSRLSIRAPQAGGGRERIDRVLQFLHAHYREPLRLEALAEVAALSPSGLHRLFRRHTRSTLSDYLIGLRIGDACARLSGTSQPVQHIAADVGYASLANFNRQFRRLRGMTPRQYRASFR